MHYKNITEYLQILAGSNVQTFCVKLVKMLFSDPHAGKNRFYLKLFSVQDKNWSE